MNSNDFLKQIVEVILNSFQQGTIQVFTWIWNGITSYLIEHWIAVIMVLLVVLIYAILRAFMGHWWILGSVLYNYFYAGALLLVGSIFGPAVFANTYADIGFLILYIICYVIVGRILARTGLKY